MSIQYCKQRGCRTPLAAEDGQGRVFIGAIQLRSRAAVLCPACKTKNDIGPVESVVGTMELAEKVFAGTGCRIAVTDLGTQERLQIFPPDNPESPTTLLFAKGEVMVTRELVIRKVKASFCRDSEGFAVGSG